MAFLLDWTGTQRVAPETVEALGVLREVRRDPGRCLSDAHALPLHFGGATLRRTLDRVFTVTDSVCIDAPAAVVWGWLARIEDIPLWSRAVVSASTVPGHERGVGAVRVCQLVGGITLAEHWVDWREGESFTYEGHGLPGVRVARNTWSVEPRGQQTILRSRAHVRLKGGLLAWPLEMAARRHARRMGRQALGVFKYLVEQGRAPNDLPTHLPAPSTC